MPVRVTVTANARLADLPNSRAIATGPASESEISVIATLRETINHGVARIGLSYTKIDFCFENEAFDSSMTDLKIDVVIPRLHALTDERGFFWSFGEGLVKLSFPRTLIVDTRLCWYTRTDSVYAGRIHTFAI